MSRLFRKTALGVATFTKQDHGLTQGQRALLIMVDGKRTAGQLRKFGTSFGDVNALLGDLYRAGLIELDPVYAEQARAALDAIAKEAKDYSSPLEAATVVGSSFTRPAPATAPTAKRDLRDLANLAEPDPIRPAAKQPSASLSLSLEPVAEGASGAMASVSETTLANARKFATRYIFDTLGNSGTPLCFAIDKADSYDRFKDVVVIAKNTLRDMKNMSVANEFQRQLDEIFNA
ncbi:MAG: hypothetical protein ACRDAM_22445 [Casimicrobium sp.]